MEIDLGDEQFYFLLRCDLYEGFDGNYDNRKHSYFLIVKDELQTQTISSVDEIKTETRWP